MIKTVLLLPLVVGLGACASQIGYHAGGLAAANEQLGQAVQQNIAAQTVNPQGSTEPVTGDGSRAALAVNRYKTDKVEKPKPLSTRAAAAASESN